MNNYKGFYKVDENNGGVCIGYFFNPETKESFSKITWDIDRPYINDNEEIEILRHLIIDDEIRKQWLTHNGVIQVGDKIEVYKGRKVKKGTIAKVIKIQAYYDQYRRWQYDYAYLDNGERINIDNCRLI